MSMHDIVACFIKPTTRARHIDWTAMETPHHRSSGSQFADGTGGGCSLAELLAIARPRSLAKRTKQVAEAAAAEAEAAGEAGAVAAVRKGLEEAEAKAHEAVDGDIISMDVAKRKELICPFYFVSHCW